MLNCSNTSIANASGRGAVAWGIMSPTSVSSDTSPIRCLRPLHNDQLLLLSRVKPSQSYSPANISAASRVCLINIIFRSLAGLQTIFSNPLPISPRLRARVSMNRAATPHHNPYWVVEHYRFLKLCRFRLLFCSVRVYLAAAPPACSICAAIDRDFQPTSDSRMPDPPRWPAN